MEAERKWNRKRGGRERERQIESEREEKCALFKIKNTKEQKM